MNKYMEEPGGHLKNGGDPGVLLFGTGNSRTGDYFKIIGPQIKLKPDELLVIPAWQIFGSEELSSRGEAIMKRAPSPFIIMNEAETGRRGLTKSESFQLMVNNTNINVIIKNDNSVPDGVVCLSFGFPGMPYLGLPCPGKLNNVIKDIK
jgi:NADH-quinone oxidoreductase subunit G